MRWLLFLLIFLLLGAFFIVSNNNLHMGNSSEREMLGDLYYEWLSSLFDNAKSLTGHVVKFDWLPSENTVSNITK